MYSRDQVKGTPDHVGLLRQQRANVSQQIGSIMPLGYVAVLRLRCVSPQCSAGVQMIRVTAEV